MLSQPILETRLLGEYRLAELVTDPVIRTLDWLVLNLHFLLLLHFLIVLHFLILLDLYHLRLAFLLSLFEVLTLISSKGLLHEVLNDIHIKINIPAQH